MQCCYGEFFRPTTLQILLINCINRFRKADLAQTALMKLHSCGIWVDNDDPTSHLSMILDLGAWISSGEIRPSSRDPSLVCRKCHFPPSLRYDPAIEKLLGDLGSHGESIWWQHFLELQKLQEEEKLWNNKLKKLARLRHVQTCQLPPTAQVGERLKQLVKEKGWSITKPEQDHWTHIT